MASLSQDTVFHGTHPVLDKSCNQTYLYAVQLEFQSRNATLTASSGNTLSPLKIEKFSHVRGKKIFQMCYMKV